MRLTLLLILAAPLLVSAQDGRFTMGGRHTALSGTSVTLDDGWAIFNNPGALGDLEESTVMVTYRNRYNIEGFHVRGGGAVYHHRLFNVGAKFYKFGDDIFSQQIFGLVLANRIQMVSLGAGFNIIQTYVEGLNTRRAAVLELGGTAALSEQLVLGAHLFNFKHGQVHPTTMKAGLSFRPIDVIMLNVELEKQIDTPEIFKAGLEYAILPSLFIRTGLHVQGNEVNQSSVNGTYGLGFLIKGFVIDYAFTNEPLGMVHEISLSYRILKKQ
ncbi:MAG: hypothetical protein ACI8WP_000528 [Flavobacteriaceae bacterium]